MSEAVADSVSCSIRSATRGSLQLSLQFFCCGRAWTQRSTVDLDMLLSSLISSLSFVIERDMRI